MGWSTEASSRAAQCGIDPGPTGSRCRVPDSWPVASGHADTLARCCLCSAQRGGGVYLFLLASRRPLHLPFQLAVCSLSGAGFHPIPRAALLEPTKRLAAVARLSGADRDAGGGPVSRDPPDFRPLSRLPSRSAPAASGIHLELGLHGVFLYRLPDQLPRAGGP